MVARKAGVTGGQREGLKDTHLALTSDILMDSTTVHLWEHMLAKLKDNSMGDNWDKQLGNEMDNPKEIQMGLQMVHLMELN